LIIPNGDNVESRVNPCNIVLRAHDYLEPKMIGAKIEKLTHIIPRFSVKNVVENNVTEPDGITTEALMNTVQGSSEEILGSLRLMDALDRNGWKIMTDLGYGGR